MPTHRPSFQLKLNNILVATDFSSFSKMAVLYATSIARRHGAKLVVTHVVTSGSERALMDGWRAGQTEIMGHLLANRLDGIEHQLVVRSGDLWTVLSQLITEMAIDLVVVGTRGRTGVQKFILGSAAQSIFRQAPCPVLTVGPSIVDQDPESGPERILAATGFAPHSLLAVNYAMKFARDLNSPLALMNVVTDTNLTGEAKDRVRDERLRRLRALIPTSVHLPSEPALFVEFGSAPEKILEAAAQWKANLIVLGLRHVEETSRAEATWAKAYKIVCQASCPVLTFRGPE